MLRMDMARIVRGLRSVRDKVASLVCIGEATNQHQNNKESKPY
jgi:hypothetical protein